MSLDVRYYTNGEKSIIRIGNSGVTPAEVDFYDKPEDVPESIRHYVPKEPKFASIDTTLMFSGLTDILYPGHGYCNFQKAEKGIRCCIADGCKYLPESGHEQCEHYLKEKQNA